MSNCQTPYVVAPGQFPPMKRCASRSHLAKGPCREHENQLALYDRPENSRIKARYGAMVAAFVAWETAVKETKGHSDQAGRVARAGRDLIAVARGK